MNYATIHTDIMVNNPNLFAYMPYDPISQYRGHVLVRPVLHQP